MVNEPEVLIFATLDELQQAAARRIAESADAAVVARGLCTIVLAGGSTPQGVYRLLTEEPLRSRVPWRQLHLLLGDERYVPLNSDESNLLAVRRTLIDHVPVPSDQVFPVPTYYKDPGQAASVYARQVEALLATAGGRFDLVLLGIGPDGHTASLFPHHPALATPPGVLVAAVEGAPKAPARRITLTVEALNRTEQTLVLATGADKAAAVRAILRGEGTPHQLPARLLQPAGGRLTWMLDQAAAGELAMTN